MNKKHPTKRDKRTRRHRRVRMKITGTAARPRLSVFRSLTGMFVQLIDDERGVVLAAVSVKKDGKSGDAGERTGKVAESYRIGRVLAEKAKAANITTVVFDRGGYAYHGRVRAVAEGARDGGLQF